MSNFSFLASQFPEIAREAMEAESLAQISPKSCAVFSRSALEKAVFWMYENDNRLRFPYDRNLASLLFQHDFKSIVDYRLFQEIKLVKDIGNNGAHGKSISQVEAMASLKNLFRFLAFLGFYYGNPQLKSQPFNESLIPDGEELKRSKAQMQELVARLEAQNEQLRKERAEREIEQESAKELKEQFIKIQKETTERRELREQTYVLEEVVPVLLPEATTRKLYIDVLLKDAGWENLRKGFELEYEVKGMPISTNPSGKGYADYVIWGKNGKPLAVIEAKHTMVDEKKGRYQAELYADCLEKMHGQRPIIFYSNGFETNIWDDSFGINRPVQGFYTQDELQRSVDRRRDRKDPRLFQPNTKIAGRAYQLEAIKRVAENIAITGKDGKLREARRHSLLVMATGSGKTRTSAALVDMLTKCNWAKRILFLADRNALVTQAKNAFKEYLPDLTTIDLTQENDDGEARIVFSTYPTIMNRIDAIKSGDGRFYGVGNFDLIIIDEAHRSVYQSYRAIFEYFDSMLIGLTATPKTDIEKNTYDLFHIEDNNPTFAYELTRAVEEGFLVPMKSLSVPLKFQREGIKYHELSEAEKLEYEEKFGDPTKEEAPDEIGSSALNKWLFNTGTVDKVLAHLMEVGIKVSGGDKLGKTIIFAKNHQHALFIEDRFNKNYPEYGGKFLRVIDNYESKAQALLEKFVDEIKEVDPQIAVSVDMMDTGVDAPRVVNLVFFKPVKSPTKFWQMIGRGTRLCPDLFGPGDHKKEFLILDYCQNFEFFDENPDGLIQSIAKPLQQQIFEAKLDIAMLVGNLHEISPDDAETRENYLNQLNQTVSNLERKRFVVRKELRFVERFSKSEVWQNLNSTYINDIKSHLSHLESGASGDEELARRFDILVLNLQIARLRNSQSARNMIINIIGTAQVLQRKTTIPEIVENLPLLKDIQKDVFWENANTKSIENVRLSLRGLIRFLDKQNQTPVYTHFEDDLNLDGIVVKEPMSTYGNLQSYKDRVESYIRKNRHHFSIDKLNKNIPITEADLKALEDILFTNEAAQNKQQFEKEYGDQPLGVFIRSIVGLDIKAAQDAFADFINVGTLSADQITFIKNIITYLSKNGTIDKLMLFESPFTNDHFEGLTGVFKKETEVIQLVRIIDTINANAGVG
ncbi:MAG: DEAD/DEAH box helicase family protein [Cytophagaceae bacterium]|nr:DEAD/DEAH box helicase family protein [Cytophagaceae bacterium]MBL0324533.1 DEAD/DEAH box helicase family protein [Cytophagaceae bacterium]